MENSPIKYSLKTGLTKGCRYIAKLIVAFALSHGIAFAGTINGIDVDLRSEVVIGGLLNYIIIVVANALKVKYPKWFWWI